MKIATGLLVVFAVGVGVGRYYIPTNKSQSSESENSSETTERETKNPDGTVIKERIVKKIEYRNNTTVVESKKPDWRALGLAGYSFDNNKPVYGAAIERRVLGSVFVGAYGTTNKEVGLTVGYEF